MAAIFLFCLFFLTNTFSLFAQAETAPKFFIDIANTDAYILQGFDAENVLRDNYNLEDPSLIKFKINKQISNRDISRLRGKKYKFLSPLKQDTIENTIVIPFFVDTAHYDLLKYTRIIPALYLAGIGDNWEAYVNGNFIGGSIPKENNGKMAGSAQRRLVLPVERTLFLEGQNMLAIRVLGEEFDDTTGLFYSSPYFFAEQKAAEAEAAAKYIFNIVLITIGILIGIIYFLFFVFEPLERYYLFYSLTSLLCAFYLFSRNEFIRTIIQNSHITFAIEYFSFFLILPLFTLFLESFSLKKTRRAAIYFLISAFLLGLLQIPFSMTFRGDTLRLWQFIVSLLMPCIFVIDLLLPFIKEVRTLIAQNKKNPIVFSVSSLITMPLGNLILAAVLLGVFVLIDIMNSMLFHKETSFMMQGGLIFYAATVFSLMHSSTIAKRKIKYTGEEHKNYLDLILINSPDILVLFDAEQNLVRATNTFLNLLPDYSIERLQGMNYEKLFNIVLDGAPSDNLKQILQEAIKQRKPALFFESINFIKSGARHQYEVHFTPMIGVTGQLEGSLLLLSDITDVLKATQEAESANRAKTSFLATISHEMRTPLNAILGLAEIQLMGDLSHKTKIDLEKIYLSGETLLRIINDVLDISKIESKKFTIEPYNYNLVDLVNESIQVNITRISEKPIRFSLEINEQIPISLNGDELRIKQIINNLLSNAFKYTKRGNVELTIDYENYENEKLDLIIKVRDTGIGIKKENIPALFGDYMRFEYETNKLIEGTGLGLSITKKLVDLMQGNIQVESEYGRGSIFSVRLPQNVVSNTVMSEKTAYELKSLQYTAKTEKLKITRKNFSGKKILVVDDVALNIDVAKGMLSLYGMEVHGVASGKTAVELVRSETPRYDMLIIDHMMPGLSGLEAAKIIRREIQTPYAENIPLIIFTANILESNKELFLKNGFNGYLTKPIDAYQLDSLLNEFFVNDDNADYNTDSISDMEELDAVEESVDESSVTSIDELLSEIGINVKLGIENCVERDIFINALKSSVLNLPNMLLSAEESANELRAAERFTPEELQEKIMDYRIKIHGLKGALRGIYHEEGGEAAFRLEKYAENENIEEILKNNDDFVSLMQTFVGEASVILNESNNKKSKIVKQSPDINMLRSLSAAALHYKVQDMEEIMHSLERYDYEENASLVQYLQEKMASLEYDLIVEKLKEFI